MHMYLYLCLLHKLAHRANQATKLLDQPPSHSSTAVYPPPSKGSS